MCPGRIVCPVWRTHSTSLSSQIHRAVDAGVIQDVEPADGGYLIILADSGTHLLRYSELVAFLMGVSAVLDRFGQI
jgi:hypothetical protein